MYKLRITIKFSRCKKILISLADRNFNTKYPPRESMLLQSSTYFNAYGFLLINHSLLIGSLGGAKIKVANVLEEKERKKKSLDIEINYSPIEKAWNLLKGLLKRAPSSYVIPSSPLFQISLLNSDFRIHPWWSPRPSWSGRDVIRIQAASSIYSFIRRVARVAWAIPKQETWSVSKLCSFSGWSTN